MFRYQGRPKYGHAIVPKIAGTTLRPFDSKMVDAFASNVIGTPTTEGSLKTSWFFDDSDGFTYMPVSGSKLGANRLIIYGWADTKGQCDLYYLASNVDNCVLAMDSRMIRDYAGSKMRGLTEMPLVVYNTSSGRFTENGTTIPPRGTIGPLLFYDSATEWTHDDMFLACKWNAISDVVKARVELTSTQINTIIDQWSAIHNWRPTKRSRVEEDHPAMSMAPAAAAPARSTAPVLHQAMFMAPADAETMRVQSSTITDQERTILDLKRKTEELEKERDDAMRVQSSTITGLKKERDDAIIKASQLTDRVRTLSTAVEGNHKIIQDTGEKLAEVLKELDDVKKESARLKLANVSMRNARTYTSKKVGDEVAEMQTTIRRHKGETDRLKKIIQDLNEQRDLLRAELRKIKAGDGIPDDPQPVYHATTDAEVHGARACLSFVGDVLAHSNLKRPFSNRFISEELAPKIHKWSDTCPQDGRTVAIGTKLRVSFELTGGDFEWYSAIIVSGKDGVWTLFFPDDNSIVPEYKTTIDRYYEHDIPNSEDLWDFLIDPEDGRISL